MTAEAPARRRISLRALSVPNFRAYFAGQLISNTGTWFQNLSISLIVAQVTGSASALALVTVAQFGPVLLLSGIAGRLADTLRPRTILLWTAALSSLATAGLALALLSGDPNLPLLYGLIAVCGAVQAFERAASQAIVFELVGPELLQNGVVLSTVYLSAARSIGPGLAGLAFVSFGPAVCMLINAATYVVQFALVLAIRRDRLNARPLPDGERPTLVANLRAVGANRPLVAVLVINVLVTVGALSFNVVLTAVVALEFSGDASALGATHALNAVGAIVGALLVTLLHRIEPRTLIPACLVFGGALAVNALAPSTPLLLLAAPLLGLGLGAYQSVLNAAAQSVTPPYALGRTMSLLTMGNLGMAPVGALLMGLLIDATSGRTALATGAAVCALCAIGASVVLRRRRSGVAG